MSTSEGSSGIFDHELEPVQPLPEPVTRPSPAPAPEPVSPADGEPDPPSPAVASPELPRPVEVAGAAPAALEHAVGELDVPPGLRVFGGAPNGARRSVGIAVSKFNGDVTSRLLEGAITELEAVGVAREAIDVMPVPGAFELPLAAMALAKSRRYSCVLALGCVIRGETPHFDYVAAEAASGVQLAGLETGIPVAFGVLTCDTAEQAEARAGGARGNKGAEAARSALEMVEALSQLRATVAS